MAKKKAKNHPPSARWKKYKVSGSKLERAPSCPKCGPGTFLAQHNDRVYCGSCHYTEWITKK